MSTLHKEYHKLSENGKWKCKERDIKMTISYNKETTSWATSQPIQRGYRVCVVPVEISPRENGIVMESYGAFTGFNDTLLPVERQSAKRLEKAIEIMHERVDKYL